MAFIFRLPLRKQTPCCLESLSRRDSSSIALPAGLSYGEKTGEGQDSFSLDKNFRKE
jgi:hypothetical protein